MWVFHLVVYKGGESTREGQPITVLCKESQRSSRGQLITAWVPPCTDSRRSSRHPRIESRLRECPTQKLIRWGAPWSRPVLRLLHLKINFLSAKEGTKEARKAQLSRRLQGRSGFCEGRQSGSRVQEAYQFKRVKKMRYSDYLTHLMQFQQKSRSKSR